MFYKNETDKEKSIQTLCLKYLCEKIAYKQIKCEMQILQKWSLLSSHCKLTNNCKNTTLNIIALIMLGYISTTVTKLKIKVIMDPWLFFTGPGGPLHFEKYCFKQFKQCMTVVSIFRFANKVQADSNSIANNNNKKKKT